MTKVGTASKSVTIKPKNGAVLYRDIHPALNLSTLINNLKSASSRRIRNAFPDHIKKFYSKPVFWHRAYFAGTVGKVTLETVRRYVEQQGTKEKPRKQ